MDARFFLIALLIAVALVVIGLQMFPAVNPTAYILIVIIVAALLALSITWWLGSNSKTGG